MHKYIGFIAVAFAILGAISNGLMFWGHANNGGMAIVAFQLWTVIGTIAALLFALISRFMAKAKSETPHGASKLAMVIAMITLLTLILGLIFIG